MCASHAIGDRGNRLVLDTYEAALPQAEVQAFDDAGHYVLEDRHEVLVPRIRAFLDAHPLQAG